MYQVEASGALLERGQATRERGRVRVGRNVVLLGLTSMLTDVSSEMVATILPLYLVFALGASPLQFGLIDGLYQGASALVRVAAGFVSDRWRRHKEVAALGYGLSALCKALLAVAGGAIGALGAIVFIDRTGKGIRTAPRDALISLSTSPRNAGAAFGVHRALDTAGAMLGPLIAFGLLLIAPGRFDAIFVVSLCFALLGLAVLVLLVDGKPQEMVRAGRNRPSVRAAAALLRPGRFRVLVLAAGGLALFTVSDGFLYLGLQRQMDFAPTVLPLLFVGSALAYMALSIPMGRLADRVGRVPVFLGGYVVLLVAYTSLLVPTLGPAALGAYLLMIGAYYAATDGVLMAVATSLLPPELRASGMSFVVTATSIARLVASILFGLLWTVWSMEAATVAFGAALAVALAVAALALRGLGQPEAAGA